jgi:hypothetical protein
MSIEDCLRTSTFSTLELDALQDRFGARKFNDLIAKEISKEFNSKSECRGKNFQGTFMFVTLLTLIFLFYFLFKVAPFKLNPFYPNNLRHILIFYTATSPTYTRNMNSNFLQILDNPRYNYQDILLPPLVIFVHFTFNSTDPHDYKMATRFTSVTFCKLSPENLKNIAGRSNYNLT